MASANKMIRNQAVTIIQRAWLSFRQVAAAKAKREAMASAKNKFMSNQTYSKQTMALMKVAHQTDSRVPGDDKKERIFSFETGSYIDEVGHRTEHIKHVIPGYTGHLPMRTDQVGKTFARTGQAALHAYRDMLLTDPQTASVPNDATIKDSLKRFDMNGRGFCEPGSAAEFVPAHMIGVYEGEARQRQHEHLGAHARAPYGVDRIDEPLGRVNYQTMNQTGPGNFFRKEQAERATQAINQGLAAALSHSLNVGKEDGRRGSASLASQIAHRRLSTSAHRRSSERLG